MIEQIITLGELIIIVTLGFIGANVYEIKREINKLKEDLKK